MTGPLGSPPGRWAIAIAAVLFVLAMLILRV